MTGAVPSCVFLIFELACADRPEVGRRCGHDHGIGVMRRSQDGLRISAVVTTRTTLTPAGSGSATFAATSVTVAPRLAAALASA